MVSLERKDLLEGWCFVLWMMLRRHSEEILNPSEVFIHGHVLFLEKNATRTIVDMILKMDQVVGW